MKNETLSNALSTGAFLITVLLFNGIAYDPVNLPKLALLVPLSGILISLSIFNALHNLDTTSKNILYLVGFFLLGSLISAITGKLPFVTNFYGSAGRNTGTLTYICLGILFASAFLLRDVQEILRVFKYFIFAGYVNLLYSAIVVITGKDPFPWNNVYKNILGTFGNPDFISAFFGICFSVSLAYFSIGSKRTRFSYINFFLLPIYLFLILESQALQGLLVAGIGLIVTVFFIVRDKFDFKLQISYLSVVIFIALISVLGMLQMGPLSSLLYKPSVSFRGEYWHAGINMFLNSPITGIGFDSYGDFYRRMREPSALISPGVTTVTDASHNVFIDLLAGGGLVVIIPFLVLQICVAKRVFEYIKINKKYDPIFVALFVGWVTFNSQAFVSINQIGLAIWGWIFPGLLLSYLKIYNGRENLGIKNKLKRSQEQILPAKAYIMTVISFLLSLSLILPLIISEHSWKNSMTSKDATKIIQSSNRWPQTNSRFVNTISIFVNSKAPVEALETARLSVKFNADFYDAWYYIYNITGNLTEKNKAYRNLHRLDPLNPDWK